MKSLISKIVAALLFAASLAGCANMGPQESASDWMANQPTQTDD